MSVGRQIEQRQKASQEYLGKLQFCKKKVVNPGARRVNLWIDQIGAHNGQ